jgi:hypothetical protein
MKPIELKLSVGYADQNEPFKEFLPRSGSISRQIALDDWGDDWFVFMLDEPFEYQLKTDEPFRFKLVQIDHFLIRSRWLGHPVGGSDETSVFILLDPENRIEHQDRFSSSDFIHICWGTASPHETGSAIKS